mmetsp:Transcript_29540/g.45001  ORF Transcript_29540/g.45001 Transcript_29540/m.45001 type:complete len:132 (+) Transcript_29540:3101-3496(+)
MGFRQIESNLQKLNERERYQPSVSDNVSDIPHYEHITSSHIPMPTEGFSNLNKRQAKQAAKDGGYFANFSSPVKKGHSKFIASSATKGENSANKKRSTFKQKLKKKEPLAIPHPDSVFDMKAIEEEIALEK